MKKIIGMFLVVFLMAVAGVSAQISSITATSSFVGVTSAIVDIVPNTQANHPYSCVVVYGINSVNEYTTMPYVYQFGTVWPVSIQGLIPGVTYLFQGIVFDSTGFTVSSVVGNFTTGTCPLDASFGIGNSGPCFTELNAILVDPSLSYCWFLNGNQVGSTNLPFYIARESGNYQLSVWNNECTVFSSIIWVNVQSLSLQGVIQSTVCQGEKASVSISGANHYSWSPSEWFDDPQASNTFINTEKIGWMTGTVSFSVTAYQDDCVKTEYFTIEILPKVNLSFFNIVGVCVKDRPISLIGLTHPSGGIFSGEGVQGDKFFPEQAGVGSHKITYSLINSNGCISTASGDVSVYGSPEVHSWKFGNNDLVILGVYLDNTSVTAGNMSLIPTLQSSDKIIFENVSVNNGDKIIIRGINSECSTFIDVLGLGISELDLQRKGMIDSRIFNVLGQEIKNPIPNRLYIKGGKKFIYKE